MEGIERLTIIDLLLKYSLLDHITKDHKIKKRVSSTKLANWLSNG